MSETGAAISRGGYTAIGADLPGHVDRRRTGNQNRTSAGYTISKKPAIA